MESLHRLPDKMRVLKLSEESLKEAVGVLNSGGVVVYPTETVYGLGVDATNEEAVEKIFKIKERERGKPVSIAVGSVKEAKKYCEWNELAEKIAKKFLPGPLTIILKRKDCLVEELNPDEKVRIRIPDHSFVLKLLKEFGKPITATSANLSGGENPTDVKIAIEQIGDKVDLILDDGECKYKKSSTVIDLSDELKIYRVGVISEEDIRKVIS
jgi:L-threonylcarbamoyladenylate synthase